MKTASKAICLLSAFTLLMSACSGSDAEPSVATVAAAAPTSEAQEATTTTEVVEREQLEIPAEWDSELDEIYGRYLLYRQAFNIAAGPPVIDPDYGPLQELSAGEQAELDREFLEARAAEGVVYLQPENSIGRAEIRPPQGPQVFSKTEGNEFVFSICGVNDDIVQTIDGEVLNDQVQSFFQDIELTVVDGEWRVTGRATRGELREGEEACENFLP